MLKSLRKRKPSDLSESDIRQGSIPAGWRELPLALSNISILNRGGMANLPESSGKILLTGIWASSLN